MISAKSQGDVISNALWLGATDFIVKPFQTPVLLAKLRHIFAGSRRGSNPVRTEDRIGHCETLVEELRPHCLLISCLSRKVSLARICTTSVHLDRPSGVPKARLSRG